MPINQKIIDSFTGDYEFLSNFYPSSIIGEDGITYPTVEHYFQAHKTLDMNERRKMATARSPGIVKRAGRAIDLRPDWEKIKLQVMHDGLRLKFEIPELREQLLATGDAELCEGNTWHDNFYGDCHCEKCKGIIGHNHLGRLLYLLREEIKKGKIK